MVFYFSCAWMFCLLSRSLLGKYFINQILMDVNVKVLLNSHYVFIDGCKWRRRGPLAVRVHPSIKV